MEEAHRQALQSMTLMLISSPRCNKSNHRDEKSTVSSQITQPVEEKRHSQLYEKLKVNHNLKKRELAVVRASFKEQRI